MMTPTKQTILGILVTTATCFAASASITDALKVKLVNGSYSDEAVIRFVPTATSGFDGSYDSYKMFSGSSLAPAVYTNLDPTTHLSINALPTLSTQVDIDLYTYVQTTALYTLQSIELGAFASSVKIVLEDKVTGILYNFRNGNSINVNIPSNTMATANRFVIHFSPAPIITVSEVTCNSMANGILTITKPGNHNFNYDLKNSGGASISAASGIDETISIGGLVADNYKLYVTSAVTLNDTCSLSITEPAAVNADFSASADVVYLSNALINFTNASSAAASYSWNFGDGSAISTTPSPTHQYTSTGSYAVTLTAQNTNGCSNSITKNILVNPDLTTGIFGNNNTNEVNAFVNNGNMELHYHSTVGGVIEIRIYNELGQQVYALTRTNASEISEIISLNVTGNYFITSIINGKPHSQKINYTK